MEHHEPLRRLYVNGNQVPILTGEIVKRDEQWTVEAVVADQWTDEATTYDIRATASEHFVGRCPLTHELLDSHTLLTFVKVDEDESR